MKAGLFGLNSIFLGALAAGLSIVIVLGSLLLAFTEGGGTTSIASYPTLESVGIFTPSPEPRTSAPNTPTFTPTIQPSPTSTQTITASPVPSTCDPPTGWEAYTVKSSDTLNKLAESVGLNPQELADANCLTESRLVPDSILYLPVPSPTNTPVKCSPPSHWVVYIVQPGDTLFSIAQRVNLSASQLRSANCLTSDKLHTGQKLYVPYLPPHIPNPTSVPPTAQPPPPTSPPPTSPPPTSPPVPTAIPTDSNVAKNTPTP